MNDYMRRDVKKILEYRRLHDIQIAGTDRLIFILNNIDGVEEASCCAWDAWGRFTITLESNHHGNAIKRYFVVDGCESTKTTCQQTGKTSLFYGFYSPYNKDLATSILNIINCKPRHIKKLKELVG